MTEHTPSREGWDIFAVDADGHAPREIQRIDAPEDGSDPCFESDQEAIAFVVARALAGSRMHLDALRTCKDDPPVIDACLAAGISLEADHA